MELRVSHYIIVMGIAMENANRQCAYIRVSKQSITGCDNLSNIKILSSFIHSCLGDVVYDRFETAKNK
jgi:hypothetical protein